MPNEYAEVRAENDRVSREVALFPDRLRGFCGVNPLKDYALEEIARCAKDPQMHYGLKLHFGNSDVDLLNPAHIARLREVFRAANDARMAIVVHLRSTISRQRPYGAEQVRSFISSMLPAAPDIRSRSRTSPAAAATTIRWSTRRSGPSSRRSRRTTRGSRASTSRCPASPATESVKSRPASSPGASGNSASIAFSMARTGQAPAGPRGMRGRCF